MDMTELRRINQEATLSQARAIHCLLTTTPGRPGGWTQAGSLIVSPGAHVRFFADTMTARFTDLDGTDRSMAFPHGTCYGTVEAMLTALAAHLTAAQAPEGGGLPV
jgi:hypothetical protein